jgi:hypothetical protein
VVIAVGMISNETFRWGVCDAMGRYVIVTWLPREYRVRVAVSTIKST